MSLGSEHQTYYSQGYDTSVSNTHLWRTAESCSSYMLHLIKPNSVILDVGCGPGSITLDLAKRVPSGKVIGIEPSVEVLDEANKKLAENDITNAEFKVALAYKLPFDDNTFDIVHSHQVLIHLVNPLLALQEMKRVVKPTGYVCCRDADLDLTTAYPTKYNDSIRYYFLSKTTRSPTCATRGRSLHELAQKAGFKPRLIRSTAGNWCISSPADRAWFGEMYKNRIEKSFETFDENPDANEKKKEEIIKAFNDWIKDDLGWLLMIHGEIVCQKELHND